MPIHNQTSIVAIAAFAALFTNPVTGSAQSQILSTAPPAVEYQYQMYYPRIWGWPGPGWSIGGSLPSNTREGISSFYGQPVPAPLGSGVYMNSYVYSTQLPGAPFTFGLASPTATLPAVPQQPSTPMIRSSDANPVLPFSQGATSTSVSVAKPTIAASSNEAKERSREIQWMGDENMKKLQWTQAYINYRNAVITAPDRPEVQVRMALTSIIMNRFPEAVLAFKQALSLDPSTGRSGETFESIFGVESQTIRAEMVQDVANWTKQNVKDQDRLFLLGMALLYTGDGRSTEILQAALKLPGSNEHLLAVTTPVAALPTIAVSPVPPTPAPPSPNTIAQTLVHEPTILPPPAPVSLPELHDRPLALR